MLGFRAKPTPQTAGKICRTKAHYPYCAYNDKWSCPFPPPEDRLKAEGPEGRGIRIEVGENNYQP